MRRQHIVAGLSTALLAAALVVTGVGAGLAAGFASGQGHTPRSPGAILVVTNTADSGPGTLRSALQAAGNGDTITFETAVFPPASPATIVLSTELPGLAGGVTIDASNAGVVLDGSGTAADVDGLVISSNGNVVKGLQILNFGGDGILVTGGAQGNVLGGNRLVGAGPSGEGNVISGNGNAGVRITGSTTTGNTVSGNLIGADASGTVAVGNGTTPNVGGWGVVLDGAPGDTIGGTTAGERNLISGNGDLYCGPPQDARANGGGVLIQNGADGNRVQGNFIGTDLNGTAALPNAVDGVLVSNATGNLIGGPAAGQSNLISGNSCGGPPPPRTGVSLLANGNTVQGNRIGTDVTGSVALPNGWAGVWIGNGDSGNTVRDNLISGNNAQGIYVGGSDNTIVGNRVGTDEAGTGPLPNGGIRNRPAGRGQWQRGGRHGPRRWQQHQR